jgi:hypothetical protein
MCAAITHVRFTPNSDRKSTCRNGDVQCISSCLLWAKSGHRRKPLHEHRDARQDNPDFGELAGLGINLD